MPQKPSAKAPRPVGAIHQSDPSPFRQVLRQFGGEEGFVHKPGTVVDTTHWKHADKLVRLRYLSDFTLADPAQV